MKRLILASILFLFPFYAQAGFPEGENGYDLKKIEAVSYTHLTLPTMRTV